MPSQPLLKPTPRARSPTLLGITINSTLGTKSRARDYVPLLLAALRKLVVADLALLKAMVHSRESNSAFLDLNSSSERMPF